MESEDKHRERILEMLTRKSNLKQKITDGTAGIFSMFKDTMLELASELDDDLEGKLNKRVRIEYRDRGKFEAQLHIAEDIIILAMHTDVFDFPADHPVMQNQYAQQSSDSTYCGVINVYNFLSDSFKFNRQEDEGYLIGRIFINHERCFFVEGLKSCEFGCESFGARQLDKLAVVDIIEAAIEYAMSFDLLVSPFEAVKLATVEQFNTKMETSKFRTGKRLGYEFKLEE